MYVDGWCVSQQQWLRMPPGPSTDSVSALVELVSELVREKDETRRLLSAFSKGEYSPDQIVNELASRYQMGIGGAVQALAEYDRDAAQQLGERLKSRLDSALADIASRTPSVRAGKTDGEQPAQAVGIASFKEREDPVLRREYVLLSALSGRNTAVRSGDLIKAAQAIEPDLSDEAVTAHLIRLHNASIIGKERKGRYSATPESNKHLGLLVREIEARGINLPPKPSLPE